jgi:hypothetical protein
MIVERNMMVTKERSLNRESSDTREGEEEGYVGLYLSNCNRKAVDVNYFLSIINAMGEVYYLLQFQDEEGVNIVCTVQPFSRYGFVMSKKYADMVNPSNKVLIDDSLRVDVVIQMKQEQDKLYLPPNSHSQKMLNLLCSKDEADLLFNVRGTEVLAHSQIVKAVALILASCGTVINKTDGGGLKTTGDVSVSIGKIAEDVSPEAFEIFLKYIYLGCYPCAADMAKN